MEKFLDDLFAKRGSVRESALSLIVDGLKLNHRSQFAEKNFATLLYRCLNSIKKGSSNEIALACRALGLLSITVGYGDHAEELCKELLPAISQALKSKNESVLLSVIDCLAVATFVGASDSEQTEASMQILWRFIFCENVVAKKHSACVLSAAISAWSFLLTAIDGWNLNHHYWQGAIPCFLDLLEVDDESVRMAAGEAIALICEVGSLDKFSINTTIDEVSLDEKGKNIINQNPSVQELQEIVANHATELLRRASLESAALKTVNGWSNFSLNILEVLQNDSFPETGLKIGRHSLVLNSLSQLLQVNFIKRFLGRGFVPHMMTNEFLHDVFNFTPVKQMPGDELYGLEREEVTINFFLPESRQSGGGKDWTHRPSRSAVLKAKTKLLNKERLRKESEEELWPSED